MSSGKTSFWTALTMACGSTGSLPFKGADRGGAASEPAVFPRAKRAAEAPANAPVEIAHAALWLPPPVKPPQIGSRVALSPAA